MMGRYGANAPEKIIIAMQFSSAEFTIGAVRAADLPQDDQPEIAFAGRSNVGKSSLINKLLQRKKLARTSSTPGKTQQLNYYRINESFYFVDLPGYGFVQGGVDLRARLGRMVRGYVEKRAPLRAVIQLIDARHGPTELDLMMIDWLKETEKPFLLVFTKADKLSRSKQHRLFERLESEGTLVDISFVPFSATSGQGRKDVLEWIDEVLQDAKTRR
jgi:GTP-binding protein